jgi:hypothetical protein
MLATERPMQPLHSSAASETGSTPGSGRPHGRHDGGLRLPARRAAGASFGRHQGQEAVRAVWESMDEHIPGYTQEIVDTFAAGDRCACRFVIRWKDAHSDDAALHGVDVITVGRLDRRKLTYGTL